MPHTFSGVGIIKNKSKNLQWQNHLLEKILAWLPLSIAWWKCCLISNVMVQLLILVELFKPNWISMWKSSEKETSGHPKIHILTQWIIPFGIRCQRKYTKDTQRCVMNVNSKWDIARTKYLLESSGILFQVVKRILEQFLKYIEAILLTYFSKFKVTMQLYELCHCSFWLMFLRTRLKKKYAT